MVKSKLFLETSFFIRFFTRDIESKYEDCVKLIEEIELGRHTPYISNVVVMEIVFILTRHYSFKLEEVLTDVQSIFDLRNVVVVEKTDTRQALNFLKKYKIKLGDCFIATQVVKGMPLITYDKDFEKIKSLKAMTPKEVLELV